MDRAKHGHVLSSVFNLGIVTNRAAAKLTDKLRRIELKAKTYIKQASPTLPRKQLEMDMLNIFRPVAKLLNLPSWPISVKLDITATDNNMIVIPAEDVEQYAIPILKNSNGDGLVAGGIDEK
jgi:hypothetical protein